MFQDFTKEQIEAIMQNAWSAFHVYRTFSLKQRAGFMKAIAIELENAGDALIQTAMRETHLPEARLRGERARTIFQLNSYADACEKGARVLLADDLLATGGTALAAAKLLGSVGAELVGAAFIVDLPDLDGSRRLRAEGIVVDTLIEFPGH